MDQYTFAARGQLNLEFVKELEVLPIILIENRTSVQGFSFVILLDNKVKEMLYIKQYDFTKMWLIF